MPRCVVFETPGVLDLRAITCIGVNTKPNSANPIGFFGTGLKYAVAVLARNEIPLTLVTDGQVYAFYRKTERFRDKDFDFVRMKRETLERTLRSKAEYSQLSYTTEYGKTWKLWQVFRELYSNTLDEGGVTYARDGVEQITYAPDTTYIIVVSDEFAAEYDQRDKNFLPDGLRVQQQNERIQVLDRPSSHIYYRGMRVMDLSTPSAVTYNFLSGVELTEDRTAKNTFLIDHYIQQFLLTEAPVEIVTKAVSAEEDTMESRLSFTHQSSEPSAAFKQAVMVGGGKVNLTASAYVSRRTAVAEVVDVLREWPKPWYAKNGGIYDASGVRILSCDVEMSQPQLSYVAKLLDSELGTWEQREWARENADELEQVAAEALEEEDGEVIF